MKKIFSIMVAGLLMAAACNPVEKEPARTHETFTVKPTEAAVEVGESFNLNVTSKPVYDDLVLTFETSNKDVATVTEQGLVNAVAEGEATITVKNNIDDKIAECKVTVSKKVVLESITLEPAELTVAIGSTVALNMTPVPAIPDLEYTWASSNTEVLTVDQEGNVTGVSEGEATVTVTNALYDKSATAKVTVTIKLFSGGKGTENDPYQIATYEDLQLLSEYSQGGDRISKYTFESASYKLTADITASLTDTTNYYKTAFTDIAKPFRGTFDGNGKTISSILIGDAFASEKPVVELADTNSVKFATGLFGFVSGATIKDLTFNNIRVQSNQPNVGAVAGYVDNATIQNCKVLGGVPACVESNGDYIDNASVSTLDGSYIYGKGLYVKAKGSVTPSPFGTDLYEFQYGIVGGIVGWATGTTTISNCSVNAYVRAKNRSVGGIAGALTGSATVTNCDTDGYVWGSMTMIGGVVGQMMENNVITGCTCKSKVYAKYSYLGGIVAFGIGGKVINCKKIGGAVMAGINNTNAAIRGAGIFGSANVVAVEISGCEVENCNIKSNGTCWGGIIGRSDGGAKISNCKVKDSNVDITSGVHEAAGIAGWIKNVAEITDCDVINTKVVGKAYCSGILGYTDGTETKITNCNVENVEVNAAGASIGGILGAATKSTPEITNCHVKNSTVMTTGGAYVGGVHGEAQMAATIKGCSVRNCTVKGSANFVGGVIAYSKVALLTVEDTKVVETEVIGNGMGAAGLIGRSDFSMNVKNCYVSGSVKTTEATTNDTGYNIGGLVGCMNAPAGETYYNIDNCCVEADVSGQYQVGGICGLACSPNGAKGGYVITNTCYKGKLTATAAHRKYPNANTAGIIGYAGNTTNNIPVFAVNVYARPTSINFTSAVTAGSGGFGGLYGYAQWNNTTAIGYSDLTKEKIFKDGAPIDDTQARVGGICGVTCYNASGSNGTFDYQGLFYDETIGFGPTNDGKGNPDCTDCAGLPAAKFTDGTLLGYLNAGVQKANANDQVKALGITASEWVAGTDGYPTIKGLPTAK